jgi:methionyl aminopeptidase
MEKIKNIRIVGKIVAEILKKLQKEAKVGVSGRDLEKTAKKMMANNNVYSSSLGYRGFPAAICVSLNNELTHGIPDDRLFQEGDLVSVDVACYRKDENGKTYHADAALTVVVGEADEKKNDLLRVTRNSLHYAIQSIQPNITTTQEIGAILEKYVRSRGYYPIKEYGGHGIGESLHEEPFIPNYKIPDKGVVIREGMIICIEPLVQMGDGKIAVSNDKWTVFSPNGYLNAHFEHTIYITSEGAEILTD